MITSSSPPAPDFLADVLAYIEAHRFEPMTVPELACVAGFSPYHFSRLFTARFGTSVMSHVRNCRLQAAALRLTGDRPPTLIDLAFDCGFESQEAFSRAFRRRYGVPPGQFQKEHLQKQNGERSMSSSRASASVARLDDLVVRDGFSIVGIRAAFGQHNKSGIPALWPRLIRSLPLQGQAGRVSYGAVWLDSREEGRFNYLAGVEVTGEADLPDGFERLELAPQTYAAFRVTLDGGPVHPQLQVALPRIWGELLPQSGLKAVTAPDLEVYPPDFEPMRRGAYLDVHIPVEKGADVA